MMKYSNGEKIQSYVNCQDGGYFLNQVDEDSILILSERIKSHRIRIEINAVNNE